MRVLSTLVVAAVLAFVALAVTGSAKIAQAADDESIRPFHFSFPEADLVDLRRRIAATRWPASLASFDPKTAALTASDRP